MGLRVRTVLLGVRVRERGLLGDKWGGSGELFLDSGVLGRADADGPAGAVVKRRGLVTGANSLKGPNVCLEFRVSLAFGTALLEPTGARL